MTRLTLAGSPGRSPHRRPSGARILTYAVLATASFLAVAPLAYLLATALTPGTAARLVDVSVFLRPSLDNFGELLGGTGYGRWMLNSLVVTSITTVLILLLDSLAGYAFARKRFKGRDVLFFGFLATLMIPLPVTLLPTFLLVDSLGLTDTYAALILPFLANPVGVFLMRQFISTIPAEIEDAARIDGLGDLAIYRRMILPLSVPALAVLAIFTFMTQWAALLWPLIISVSDASRTIPPGLASLPGQYSTNWGLVASGAALSILPILVVFLAFQRYLTAGLSGGRTTKG